MDIKMNRKLLLVISSIPLVLLLSCKVGVETPAALNTDSSLILRYSFEEISAPTLYDSSGYGNNGTIIGAVSNILYQQASSIKLGKCFEWKSNTTATTTHIIINTPQLIHNNATEFTVTGWIFFNAAPSGTHTIISKRKYLNGGHTFLIYLNGASLYFNIYYDFAGSAAANYTQINTAAMTANNWHFIACTYRYITNGTSQMKIYIDGNLSASTTTGYGPLYLTTSPIVIGNFLNATGSPGDPYPNYQFRGGATTGKMDEIRYYNRCLNADEIYQLYFSQK